MATIHCKIGGVELTKDEVKKIHEEERFILTHRAIYQVNYSWAQHRYYGQKLSNLKGYVKRGRFFAYTKGELGYLGINI